MNRKIIILALLLPLLLFVLHLSGVLTNINEPVEEFTLLESAAADEIVSWYRFYGLEHYEILGNEDTWRGDFYFEDAIDGMAYIGSYDLMLSGFSQTIFTRNGFRMSRVMPDFDLEKDWIHKPIVEARVFIDGHLLTHYKMIIEHESKTFWESSFEDIEFITEYRVENNFEFKRFREDLLKNYPMLEDVTFEKSIRYGGHKFFRIFSRNQLDEAIIETIKSDIVNDLLNRETMEDGPGGDRPWEINLTFYADGKYYNGDSYEVRSAIWTGTVNNIRDTYNEEWTTKE